MQLSRPKGPRRVRHATFRSATPDLANNAISATHRSDSFRRVQSTRYTNVLISEFHAERAPARIRRKYRLRKRADRSVAHTPSPLSCSSFAITHQTTRITFYIADRFESECRSPSIRSSPSQSACSKNPKRRGAR